MERTLADLRIQVERDKILSNGDAFDARDGIIDQINEAVAAETMQKPYAYVEWLKVAAMVVKRAYFLGTGQGPGGDIYRED
jgi:hypothetical protein